MFGNLFRKNESPYTQPSKENKRGISTSQENHSTKNPESMGDYEFNDLHDFLQIENVQQTIQLSQFGISQELHSFFHMEIPATESLTSGEHMETTEETHLAPETIEETPEIITERSIEKESIQQDNGPREILPSSETDLAAQIIVEYNESDFAQKAREVLMRRGVSEEQLPDALEHLFTKMAYKNIEAFKGDVTQILYESNFDEFNAENYIYWRFNEFTENNPMRLITNGNREALIADNFLTEELIALFLEQQDVINGTPAEEEEATIVTSEKIDELLSEIENA